jgi:hypothetical protein
MTYFPKKALINYFLTDGLWGPWSSYSSCSVTCGGGLQNRLEKNFRIRN